MVTESAIRPLRNRVTPNGEIVASASKGTMMGNRGNLHNGKKELVRLFKDKAWKTCLLEYQGIKREVMAEGAYTELFFLDEATAFSAGHRPCNDCQKERAKEFKGVWLKANAGKYELSSTNLTEIDKVLHLERIGQVNGKITFSSVISGLPDGVFIEDRGKYYLKLNSRLLEWSHSGYTSAIDIPHELEVAVLTPKSIVRCFDFDKGFIPKVHPSGLHLAGIM